MPALPGSRPLILELDLAEAPADPPQGDPVARFTNRNRHLLRPALRALHEAADDRRVVGLVARVGGSLSWTMAQELRAGVAAFAGSGKPALAWAETFVDGPRDLAAYALASAFPEIWLQPSGGLGLLGVSAQTTFLRGALDKLGVQPELEQRYEYKNAVDRISRTELTPAHRESLERLTGSIFSRALADIAHGRRMTVEHVRELVETGPRTAPEARDARLVDHLGYRDQAYAALRERLPEDAELLFADRWKPRPGLPSLPGRSRGHVALVEVRGDITSGRSRRGPGGRQVGADTVAAGLRAARTDDSARAVLLRVDSPGGSAVASDTIWREVCRVREAGKPVVVSMGDAAASGGYFVACPADVVVALPATLTGSIGVFGGKFVVADLLERMGLSTGVVEQGSRARMYSARRPFRPNERERLGAILDGIYADFVAKVASGRGLSPAAVEAVARGRVWSGADALEVGLVDVLGGLREATRIARERAGLAEDAPVQPAGHVPPLARLGRPRSSEDPRARLGSALPQLDDLAAALGLPGGSELRMPPLTLH